ncbi:MAG: hypothetical protein LDL33_15575 [Desulfomonile sp.]|nr:hypothetical protein [Desulfomonile sp.]
MARLKPKQPGSSFVLMCAIVLMGCCQEALEASASYALDAAGAVWGNLPANARITGTDTQEGIRRVDLTEDLPDSIEPNRQFCYWLVWPVDNWADAGPFLRRSIHYVTTVVTPEGTFSLGVREGVKAASAQRKQEGLLAYLCFDPQCTGELKYPLPAAYEAALENGILTTRQKDTLLSLNEMLKGRFTSLMNEWKDFTQSTYVRYSRNRLLQALADFYLLAPGMPSGTLDPEKFFDRDQRIRLRELGHPIRGRCVFHLEEKKLHILLKNCPLSQIASDWNRRRSASETGSKRPVPMLSVEPEQEHKEIDATVDASVSSVQEAENLALGFLLAIEGIKKAAP